MNPSNPGEKPNGSGDSQKNSGTGNEKPGNNATTGTTSIVGAKADVLKDKKLVLAPISVKKAQGKVTYLKKGGNGKIAVNKKNGKVTLKKGLSKGVYTVKVSVKAAGDKNHEAKSKLLTFKVKVS